MCILYLATCLRLALDHFFILLTSSSFSFSTLALSILSSILSFLLSFLFISSLPSSLSLFFSLCFSLFLPFSLSLSPYPFPLFFLNSPNFLLFLISFLFSLLSSPLSFPLLSPSFYSLSFLLSRMVRSEVSHYTGVKTRIR
jgi:hypothetical protein